MASSSSASQNPKDSALPHSSSASVGSYDVFISHRGPDVKKTFASHLYHRLRSHGLRVFLDQPELQIGDNFDSRIKHAIETASVNVAIFSPGYADSVWCLDELLLMLESGACILPVFYYVKPSDLRFTKGKDGVYARALQNLEKKTMWDHSTHEVMPRYHSTTIEGWRNALSRASGISGFDLDDFNHDEAELLDKVVNAVLKTVRKSSLSVTKFPTGLDVKVEDFEDIILSLPHQSGKPRVMGIVGVDGIGKTTLAKELFERKKSSFPESCILYDVRMSSLNSLLTKLLKGLTQKDSKVESLDDGIYLLKEHVSSSPAFVILDNVGHPDQLDDLLSVLTFLPSGSIILITSSDKGVLERSGVQESSIYELRGLNRQDSQHLFCSHAFGQPNPLPGFEDFVDKFVTACNGLPLTLKMFGALLRGKSDRPYWQEQLDKLQQSSNDIKRKLEIIYDSLSEEEQHIFLHIACSCIGEKRNLAVRLWDGSCSGALLRFEDLEKRCLVEMDSEDCLIMNGHLRDLGRSIADQKGLLRPPWLPKENKSHLLQESSNEQVLAELRRKIDDLSQQSSNELVGAELRRKIRLPTENNSHLLQESSNEQVVAELRRKIDGLSHQSSGIREVREFMILVVIMMIILLIMILAMMIWSMGLGR